MCKETVRFSDIPVHKFFELNGQELMKMTLFEGSGKKQNAVFVYGEKTGEYAFVDNDTEVIIRRVD